MGQGGGAPGKHPPQVSRPGPAQKPWQEVISATTPAPGGFSALCLKGLPDPGRARAWQTPAESWHPFAVSAGTCLSPKFVQFSGIQSPSWAPLP